MKRFLESYHKKADQGWAFSVKTFNTFGQNLARSLIDSFYLLFSVLKGIYEILLFVGLFPFWIIGWFRPFEPVELAVKESEKNLDGLGKSATLLSQNLHTFNLKNMWLFPMLASPIDIVFFIRADIDGRAREEKTSDPEKAVDILNDFLKDIDGQVTMTVSDDCLEFSSNTDRVVIKLMSITGIALRCLVSNGRVRAIYPTFR